MNHVILLVCFTFADSQNELISTTNGIWGFQTKANGELKDEVTEQ